MNNFNIWKWIISYLISKACATVVVDNKPFQVCMRLEIIECVPFTLRNNIISIPLQYNVRSLSCLLAFNFANKASVGFITSWSFAIKMAPLRFGGFPNSPIWNPIFLLTTNLVKVWRHFHLLICIGILFILIPIISRWRKLMSFCMCWKHNEKFTSW